MPTAIRNSRPVNIHGQALLTALLLSCQSVSEPIAKAAPAQGGTSNLEPTLTWPTNPVAPRRIEIAHGSFLSGTTPGQFDRRPNLEPALAPVSLSRFEIDSHPFPEGSAVRTKLTLQQAVVQCAVHQGRLCTELEWERACKGPENQPFPGASQYDSTCMKSEVGCTSGFGLQGLGSQPEWTSSTWPQEPTHPVIRGAKSNQPPPAHRCAHRGGSSETSLTRQLSFRCCYGPPNTQKIKAPILKKTYQSVKLPLAGLAKLLKQHAKTEPLSNELNYFSKETAIPVVTDHGKRDSKGFLFTVKPLLWNPEPGAQFLIVSARSGKKTSFVVAYHVLADGSYLLAASFIMKGETGPVVLAYNGYIRPRLHFSTCWGCLGETGKILFRPNDSVAILQQ